MLARFKDLCIDAVDAHDLGRFWGEVLGLELVLQDHGDSYLTGPTPQHTIWVNKVPEAKSIKHRVHFDVSTPTTAAITTAGAAVTASFGAFASATDPEGGEFCAQLRELPTAGRLDAVVIDCANPPELAGWWANLLGAQLHHEDNRYSYVTDVAGAPFERLTFMPVPESKVIKNRVHLDLVASDTGALVQAGASLLRPPDDDIDWTVMSDPAGNEFCVFADSPP